MSAANKYLPHLIVIPEDQANRDFANGFKRDMRVLHRRIHVNPVSGGWEEVLRDLLDVEMNKYDQRRVLLLIDFDDKIEERMAEITSRIPEEVRERVYFLGTRINPEKFSDNVGVTRERIGEILADECANNSPGLWNHQHLSHNQQELSRLQQDVRTFLFQ